MKGFRSSAFRAVVALFMTAGAPVALATTGTATGTIQRIYTYGDGSVLVTGFYFAGATCTNNSAFYIQGTHPHLARLMAVILAAKTSGATLAVTAQTNSCWYPQIGTDGSTYISIEP